MYIIEPKLDLADFRQPVEGEPTVADLARPGMWINFCGSAQIITHVKFVWTCTCDVGHPYRSSHAHYTHCSQLMSWSIMSLSEYRIKDHPTMRKIEYGNLLGLQHMVAIGGLILPIKIDPKYETPPVQFRYPPDIELPEAITQLQTQPRLI